MNSHWNRVLRRVATIVLLATFSQSLLAASQTTFFVYQGQLQDNGAPANGSYDLAFELYDDAAAGNQVGGTLSSPAHSVSGGLFSIGLNFGSTIFNGTQLWLQTYVNTVALSPRTAIRLAPVAEYALTVADSSVTRAGLAGTSMSFVGGLAAVAGGCGNATVGQPGAHVGDLVMVSWAGGYTPPHGILFGPGSVTAADTVKFQVCNVSNTDWSDATVPLTITTFR